MTLCRFTLFYREVFWKVSKPYFKAIFIKLLLTLFKYMKIFRHFQPCKLQSLPASSTTAVTWGSAGMWKTLGPAQLSSSSGSDLFLKDCFLNTFWFAECFPNNISHIPSTAPLLGERKKPSNFNTLKNQKVYSSAYELDEHDLPKPHDFKQIKPLLK